MIFPNKSGLKYVYNNKKISILNFFFNNKNRIFYINCWFLKMIHSYTIYIIFENINLIVIIIPLDL